MRILVTGGKGFIGKHLIKKLKKEHVVFCYDLVHFNDIRDPETLNSFFKNSECDTVVHLAALAGVRNSTAYPNAYITTNILGTLNVVKMCEKYKCRLINFSSSSVYGTATPPTKEDDKKNPISIYGMTKLAAEQIVNMAKIPTVTIRPFTVYGPNGRPDQVFYKWLNQYMRNEKITAYTQRNDISIRGYTYVDDIVSVVLTLVSKLWHSQCHEDFNIGGTEYITINQIAEIYASILPNFMDNFQRLPRPSEDISRNYADISKAEKLLGFNPKKNFKKNLEDIIRKEQKSWKKLA